MNSAINKTERLHSLDALRAIMMMLGIVLHSTELYSVGDDAFFPKDPNTSHISLNYIFGIIHIFRMPIFFLIAGFFGALLFYERGAEAMIKNRFSRVFLPFVVFLLLINPLITTVISFTEGEFNDNVSDLVTTLAFLPKITFHLWFLYHLVIISLISFLLASWLKRFPGFTWRIKKSFEWLMKRRAVFILLFSIIVFLMLVWMWDTWITTSVSFIPNLPVVVAYSIFYFLGWILFKSRHLLDTFKKYDWLFTILAVGIFTARFIFRPYIDDVVYGLLNAIIVWFFIFGLIGLFIRYASGHSTMRRYVSDASYWVYLIHLPIVVLVAGLIVDWPLPALVKFLITMIVTTAFCFLTYHYLVRSTFVGKFLNGRKYPLKS